MRKLAGTSWGGKWTDAEDCVPRSSETLSRIWVKCLVNHSKIQPADPGQNTEPGPSFDHQSNEDHTDHRDGEANLYTATEPEKRHQGHAPSREVFLHAKPPNAAENGEPDEEPPQEIQFHPWQQDTLGVNTETSCLSQPLWHQPPFKR